MKKAIKITLICVIVIVIGLSVTAGTLALIKVKPLEALAGYDKVEVVTSVNQSVAKNTANDKLIADALKTVEHSTLRALFSGNLKHEPRLNYVTKNDDKPGQTFPEPSGDYKAPVTIEGKNATSIHPDDAGYMLRFSYAVPKTTSAFKNDDGLISFDTIIMFVPVANSKIQTVKLYPYLTSELPNEFYLIYEFSAKMYTSELYDMLVEGLDMDNTQPQDPGTTV